MSTTRFTLELIEVLQEIEKEFGSDAQLLISMSDWAVTIIDIKTRQVLYDADTMAEFTHRFHVFHKGD